MPMNKPRFNAANLRAPIPGMSLTTEPGNRPWENPPQIVTVEDAIQYYAEKLLDPEKADVILDTMTEEISIESMADMLTTSSVMDGVHTIDVSVLVTPIVQEMLRYVGDAHGMEYVESYEDKEKNNVTPQHMIKEVVKEKAESMGALEGRYEEDEKPVKGLMARRSMAERE
jgi:hypothetical protein